MPIIPYTGPALAVGNSGGPWASEAGAAAQPNIKLAPRLAHFEIPPPETTLEDPYVEIYGVPAPPDSRYDEIIIRIHKDVEQFNLDFKKILDQIPEDVKGKNLSVKLSLERHVSPARPEIPVGLKSKPKPAEPIPTAAGKDSAAPPPRTRLSFAVAGHRTPHFREQVFIYLGDVNPPTIDWINSELQRAAALLGEINAAAEAEYLRREEERKAAEAAAKKSPSTGETETAQSQPRPKPQLFLYIEYEGVQTPSFVRALLPPDFWETHR